MELSSDTARVSVKVEKGAGDFVIHRELRPRLMAGLFILENLDPNGGVQKATESGSQNPEISKNHAEVQLLRNSCNVEKNNESDILRAIELGRVTEPMIMLAAVNFPNLWNRVVETFARQLLAQEEKLKGMSYFLQIGKTELAIRTLLLQKEYYRQALVLGKLFLDPIKVEELSKDAAAYFLKIGSYHIAVELLCSVGKYTEAVASIEQMENADALMSGIFITMKLGDTAKMEALRNRLMVSEKNSNEQSLPGLLSEFVLSGVSSKC